jgi:hypothetical protein
MSLRLPEEIVVDRFLPTARAMLAAELADRGLTQRAIADRLGVTQAAVSRYVSGEAPVEERFAADGRMDETVGRLADGIASGELDDYEALAELMALVREFEDRGPICAVHEEEMPALEGLSCDLCVRGRDDALETERAVLRDVRRAARLLASADAVAGHVPNVGTNVATALPDAESELDVAAVPGRLHALRGRVNVPTNPEFGGSEHVAGAVLAAAEHDPNVRGGLNLATSDALLEVARDRGVEPVEFDADYEDRDRRLRERFAEGGVPRVLFHRGAFGVEPITYVLGETGFEAASMAVELATAAGE